MSTSIAPPRREKNGKLQRPSRKDMERLRKEALEREERKTIGIVLDQPHRRGNRDQLCECSLGRFVLKHKLGRTAYDAGQEYAGIVRGLKRLIGLPGVYSNGPGMGWTADDKEVAEKIARLRQHARDAYSAMRPSDAAATRWLCCEAGPMDDVDPKDETRIERIIHGLHCLAVHFGMKPLTHRSEYGMRPATRMAFVRSGL